MAMTLETELSQLETAITSILQHGQRVTVNNNSYDRADLDTLYKMRQDCLNRIAAQSTMHRTMAEF